MWKQEIPSFKSIFCQELYLSKTIQNEIINIICTQISNKIVSQVKNVGFYFILMDEVIDISDWEQLSVVFRYVDCENCIQERFMCFVPYERVTVEALTQKLTTLLEKWGLPVMDMRGQGYDGGSMKGVEGQINQ